MQMKSSCGRDAGASTRESDDGAAKWLLWAACLLLANFFDREQLHQRVLILRPADVLFDLDQVVEVDNRKISFADANRRRMLQKDFIIAKRLDPPE